MRRYISDFVNDSPRSGIQLCSVNKGAILTKWRWSQKRNSLTTPPNIRDVFSEKNGSSPRMG